MAKDKLSAEEAAKSSGILEGRISSSSRSPKRGRFGNSFFGGERGGEGGGGSSSGGELPGNSKIDTFGSDSKRNAEEAEADRHNGLGCDSSAAATIGQGDNSGGVGQKRESEENDQAISDGNNAVSASVKSINSDIEIRSSDNKQSNSKEEDGGKLEPVKSSSSSSSSSSSYSESEQRKIAGAEVLGEGSAGDHHHLQSKDQDGNDEDDCPAIDPAAMKVYPLPLPADTVVLTGEEEDVCVLHTRAKLYRLHVKHNTVTDSTLHINETDAGGRDNDSGNHSSEAGAGGGAVGAGGGAVGGGGIDANDAEWVEVGVGPLKVLESIQTQEKPSSAAPTPASATAELGDAGTTTDSNASGGNGAVGEDVADRKLGRLVMRREDKIGGIGEATIIARNILM